MGLAVVHGIVTSYAGAITVASAPGQGTTVAMYLPRLDREVEATDHAEDALAHGHGSILFIDDEAALARLAHEMLAHLGYTAEVYTSSHAALAALAWHVRLDTTQGLEVCVQQALAAIEVGRAESDQHP